MSYESLSASPTVEIPTSDITVESDKIETPNKVRKPRKNKGHLSTKIRFQFRIRP